MLVGPELTMWPRLAPDSYLCLPTAEMTGRDHRTEKFWRVFKAAFSSDYCVSGCPLRFLRDTASKPAAGLTS